MKIANHVEIDSVNHFLLNQLVASVVQFALGNTNDPKSISQMFAAAVRQAEMNLTKTSISDKNTAHLTRIFHEWSSNPDFLDSDGNPIALSINGRKKSILSLLKKANVAINQKTLATILKSDTLKKVARGKLAMRKSYFDCKHNEQLYKHHACLTALRYFQTVNNNVHGKSTLIERTAAISDLPRAAKKDFRDFSEMQGDGLIKTINRWLESKREHSKGGRGRRSRHLEAGVHVFTFLNSTKWPNNN